MVKVSLFRNVFLVSSISSKKRTRASQPLHIEDFTRVRVNESDLTAVLVETGAMPVPSKSKNPTP